MLEIGLFCLYGLWKISANHSLLQIGRADNSNTQPFAQVIAGREKTTLTADTRVVRRGIESFRLISVTNKFHFHHCARVRDFVAFRFVPCATIRLIAWLVFPAAPTPHSS